MYYNITMLNYSLIELAAKKFWPPARAARKGGGVGGIPPRPSVARRSVPLKMGSRKV